MESHHNSHRSGSRMTESEHVIGGKYNRDLHPIYEPRCEKTGLRGF